MGYFNYNKSFNRKEKIWYILKFYYDNGPNVTKAAKTFGDVYGQCTLAQHNGFNDFVRV